MNLESKALPVPLAPHGERVRVRGGLIGNSRLFHLQDKIPETGYKQCFGRNSDHLIIPLEQPMPTSFVNTIREEMLYEYAKLISHSAYGTLQRGFITDRFKKLRDGEITISGTIREC